MTRFARAIFYFGTLHSRSRSLRDVKWPVLRLGGRRKQLTTNFHFLFSSPSRSIDLKSINDCRNALHFQVTFSLWSSSLLQLTNTWACQPPLLLSISLFRAHNLDPDDSEVLFHLSLCQAHMRQVSKRGEWNRMEVRMHLANEQKAAVASTVLCCSLEHSPVIALTKG